MEDSEENILVDILAERVKQMFDFVCLFQVLGAFSLSEEVAL